jgi:hypothetical protein
MAILYINHVTTYRYHRPVAFGAHRMMLRPRDDDDQRVLQAELAIAPEPKELAWKRDRLGNHVAIARFSERSNELRFTSHARLDHASKDFDRPRSNGTQETILLATGQMIGCNCGALSCLCRSTPT